MKKCKTCAFCGECVASKDKDVNGCSFYEKDDSADHCFVDDQKQL